MNTTTHQHTTCRRCGRTLRTARSRSLGYGPVCARIHRAETAGYTARQIAAARELIADKAIVRLRSVVYLTVSTDGTETYRTAPSGCTCPAGLKSRPCYHSAAARMLLAA